MPFVVAKIVAVPMTDTLKGIITRPVYPPGTGIWVKNVPADTDTEAGVTQADISKDTYPDNCT